MTDNNSVFLYYIILIFTSGKLFAQSIDCPVQPSVTNSEIDRLVSAVSVPDGISCLNSQLYDLEIGPMLEDADFCACKSDFREYKKSVGSLADNENQEKIESLVKNEIESTTMAAFKSRLYEIQDTAIALDTMIRKQELDTNSLYRVKECAANKLWDEIEKLQKLNEGNSSKCHNLNDRLKLFSGKETDYISSIKNELNTLTQAVNDNKPLAENHTIPLRTFYASQINQSPREDDLSNIWSYANNGIENNQEMNSTLRRSPVLRLIVQENSDDLTQELGMISFKRENELADLIDTYTNELIYNGSISSSDVTSWPKEYRETLKEKENIINKKYEDETQSIINNRDTIIKALKAQDDRCDKIFNEKTVRELFCEDLNPPENEMRNKIIPKIKNSLTSEDDLFALAKYNNDLFCNPFKRRSETVAYESLDLKNTFPSFLEQIANNESPEYEMYNEQIAPVLKSYMSVDNWTPENKEKTIEELAVILTNSEIESYGSPVSQADREAALQATRELLTDGISTTDSHLVNNEMATSIHELISKPFMSGEEPVHEQETIQGMFAESTLGETGHVSNYTLAANSEDVAKARVVATEIETAEREGRPVNQEIISANTYVPRNVSTGEVIPDARTIVVPEPTTESKSLAVSAPESNENIKEEPESNEVVNDYVAPEASGVEGPSTQIETMEEQISTSSSTTTTTTRKATSPQDNRAQELRELMAEARSEEERLNKRLADLESGNSTNDEAGRSEADRLRSEIQTVRDQNRSYASQIPQSRTIASNNNTYRDSPKPQEFQNQFIEDQAVENFPIDEDEVLGEIESTIETGLADKTTKGKNSGTAARGIQEAASGSKKIDSLGLVNGGLIPGHEEAGKASCVYPQLVYQYPCFIPMSVFDEYNEIEFETDEKVILRKRNYPDRFVNNMGLEGRTFIVYSNYKDDDNNDRVNLLTYEWVPTENLNYKDMRSPSFRSKKLSEILTNRWNPTFLRKKAKETRRVDKVYDLSLDEFIELTSKRDMQKLTEDKASSLLSNTTQLNLRVQLENKENFDKLRKAFSSKGQ